MAFSIKVTGLTPDNVSALRELATEITSQSGVTGLELGATIATLWVKAPYEAPQAIANVIATLPGRGHPRASLYAVLRKFARAV